MKKRLNAMYFSPTGTTKGVIDEIFHTIIKESQFEKGKTVDFTPLKERERGQYFNEEDVVLIGLPVYAGRVPNILLKYLNSIKGKDTLAVPLVLYGNRDYDDALIELNDILVNNGFKVIGAGSFIGEHSFSRTLAKDRPDKLDLNIAREFGKSISEKLIAGKYNEINIKGSRPYRPYYIPKDEEGNPVDIRKVTPKTDENCIDCKICAEVCPMASIDYDHVDRLIGICIKCGACIKACPTSSKYFDDIDFLRHKHELEDELKVRKEPEIFL